MSEENNTSSATDQRDSVTPNTAGEWAGPVPTPADFAALIEMAERLMRVATLNDLAYEREGSQVVKQGAVMLEEFRMKFGGRG